MNLVFAALESCDVIVLGSPVYFDSVSAQTKLMIDRCNCLMLYVKKADGTFDFERRIKKRKKGIFIAVAGPEQEFNTILTTAKGFFNWANIELAANILYPNNRNELGGVEDNEEEMIRAFIIGSQIIK